jgi:hypothetical protein
MGNSVDEKEEEHKCAYMIIYIKRKNPYVDIGRRYRLYQYEKNLLKDSQEVEVFPINHSIFNENSSAEKRK